MAVKKLRRTRRKGREQATTLQPIHTSMQLLVNRLSLIGDVITTVEIALNAQNADRDAAFAMTLRRCAADPVYAIRDEVERLFGRPAPSPSDFPPAKKAMTAEGNRGSMG